MDKCRQDKCCLDKRHHYSCNLLNMVTGVYLKFGQDWASNSFGYSWNCGDIEFVWGGGVCKVIFVSNPTTVLRLSYVVYIVSFLCEISRHPPHWAVGYGYVILKTQNTKLRKKVLKKEFIWLLKAPVIKQNFFKDFYVRLQGISNKLENCQNLSRIRLVPLSGI